MIELKKDIPSEFGLDGKTGEVKEFSQTIEAVLIQREIAIPYVEKPKKKEKE